MAESWSSDISSQIRESISVKEAVLQELPDLIARATEMFLSCLKEGGKILFCGNGGSAADAQHLAAELVVRLRGEFNRPAIPAIALTVDTSVLTAAGNDFGFEDIFSRQIEALGIPGDVLVAISTSGNSANVIRAAEAAKKAGMNTLGLLGGGGGALKEVVDLALIVPSSTTARIQEAHIMIGHIICQLVEVDLHRNSKCE